MAFPFPRNPVDGQVATQTQPDGTVLRATYYAAKNEWVVERVLPVDPSLVLTSGVPYTVTPGKDGQVLTFDKASNQWIGMTPAAAGGAGQTYAKGTQAATDTPNPPDPTKPKELLRTGALQSTLENLHHELKTWNGTAWTELFSEDTIKQWISAGSLFRGVVKESDLDVQLPWIIVQTRGMYWSWTGSPGYVVKKGDPKIGTDLEGEVLQVGDWIQSDGTKWVHVPGDLLSKQRWDSLGSFQPWSDTSWEKGSVISYQKSFFRASSLVSPGDLAPGVTPGAPGEVQKWVDITPVPHMGLADLSKVNANVANPGVHGEVFQWDANIGEWVSSDTLQIGAVRFDDAGIGPEITGFANFDFNQATPSEEDTYVPSIYAIKEYIKNQPTPFMWELDDCAALENAQDGEVPVWNATTNQWEPKSISSPIIYLGTGAWTAANVADAAQNYGMAVDTVPNPSVWAPLPGDQYIDLSTGTVTVFTGAGGIADSTRSASGITGGAQPGLDALIEDLGGLSDVTLSSPADKQVLQYEAASSQWKNVTPDYLNPTNGYTKTEVDTLINTVVTGLEHYEAVLSRADTPPSSPATNDLYIVGATPNGLWAGQANNLARWDGTAWQFEAPKASESHLVEDVAETWHWSGTAWVKVATASTTGGPAAAGELWVVGDVKQSLLSEPQFTAALPVAERSKWVLADGRDVSGSQYATITGSNRIPDLRGAFLRTAGQNADPTRRTWVAGSLGDFGEDNTARPKRAFTGTTDTTGSHGHDLNRRTGNFSPQVLYADNRHTTINNSTIETTDSGPGVRPNGNHNHTVMLNGGGDNETRPKHFCLNVFIKIN